MLLFCSASAPAADNLAAAFGEGDWGASFRYRLESVDQASFASDATASTLRARFKFQTAPVNGLSAFAEFDYVAEVFADDYNAGAGNTPNRSQYPVVADPDGDDLNQAYLQYSHEGSRLRAGRQRIIFDNARFVGNVGWRQNEQTYDAVDFHQEGGGGLEFDLVYVGNVNRIYGDEVPDGDHRHDTVLARFSRSVGEGRRLALYAYDIDDEDAPSLSNRTLGVRLTGSTATRKGKRSYTLEFARQTEGSNASVNFEADYARAELAFDFGSVTPYAGIEVLEGDAAAAGKSFRTPLATLHAFNGWADQFLSTPNAGLEDRFLGLRGKAGAWSWDVLRHDFGAESGPGDFGTEWDASLSRKIGDHHGVLLKAADFSAHNTAYVDTRKLWLQLTADF